MTIKSLLLRFKKTVTTLRLSPIRVFCLHHINDTFDPIRCYKSDWINTDSFKTIIGHMKQSYTFISLTEAKKKLKKDWIRLRRYAVLTFDDGYASIIPSLQWLEQHSIPYTLFINAHYLDGNSCSQHILENAKKKSKTITPADLIYQLYLSVSDIDKLNHSYCEIGSHGYDHIDATSLSKHEFFIQINSNNAVLNRLVNYIPFHAYTWGNHTKETDAILRRMRMTPVVMDGQMNYNDPQIIHRELFPMSISGMTY